jgi:hypothetical protein
MMAGESAQGIGNSQAAQRMEREGKDRTAIWNETGWYKGVDGRWRFEIDESQMDIDPRAMRDTRGSRVPLEKLIAYPALFTAYPSLKYYTVFYNPDVTGGKFLEDQALIVIGRGQAGDYSKTLAHEIQHAIQEREGFARGGQVSQPAPDYIAAMRDALTLRHLAKDDANGVIPAISEFETRMRRKPHPGAARLAQQFNKEKLVQDGTEAEFPHRQYQRLAGEAESRLVSRRLDMTPEQRRAEAPWVTMEKMLREEGLLKEGQKPEDVLIVRRDGGGVAQSIIQSTLPLDRHPGTLSPEDFIDIKAVYEMEFAPYKQGASSRKVPIPDWDARIGQWYIDPMTSDYGSSIDQLLLLNPATLEPGEYMVWRNEEGRGVDSDQYAKWLQEGRLPPPIKVLETEGGNLRVSDGHRRFAAALKEGRPVLALVSPMGPSPTGGREYYSKKLIGMTLTDKIARMQVEGKLPEWKGQPWSERVQPFLWKGGVAESREMDARDARFRELTKTWTGGVRVRIATTPQEYRDAIDAIIDDAISATPERMRSQVESEKPLDIRQGYDRYRTIDAAVRTSGGSSGVPVILENRQFFTADELSRLLAVVERLHPDRKGVTVDSVATEAAIGNVISRDLKHHGIKPAVRQKGDRRSFSGVVIERHSRDWDRGERPDYWIIATPDGRVRLDVSDVTRDWRKGDTVSFTARDEGPSTDERELRVTRPTQATRYRQVWSSDDVLRVTEHELNAKSRINRGFTQIVIVDASEIADGFKKHRGDNLVHTPSRMEALRGIKAFDAYPLVSGTTWEGKEGIDVADGRHRVAEAARRGKLIEVAVDPEYPLPSRYIIQGGKNEAARLTDIPAAWEAWKDKNKKAYEDLLDLRREVLKSAFPDSEVAVPMASSRDDFSKQPLLPVYHGTDAQFNVFSTKGKGTQDFGWLGAFAVDRHGAFFSENPDFASTFASARKGSRIVRAYLNITNAFYADEATDILDAAEERGGDAETVNMMRWFSRLRDKWDAFDGKDGAAFVAWLKSKGYDGVQFYEEGVGLGDDAPTQKTWVVLDPSQIKSAEVTPDSTGRIPPPSEWGQAENPDIRFRRIEAKQFPSVSQEDLDRINAKVAAMTKLARVKAIAQAKAKLSTFRKAPSTAGTIRGVVGEAEKAGEKESTDAAALLKDAIRPREKVAEGKPLARLDGIFQALSQIQDDIDAMKSAPVAERAEEARLRLAGTLFRGQPQMKKVLAQYRPLKLLEAILKHAERRIRLAKGREVAQAVKRYSSMLANERSKAYRDLTNEGRIAMDQWLEVAQKADLDTIPTVNKAISRLTGDPDGTLKDGVKPVGRYDEDFGYLFTDPEYADLQSLYDTLQNIETKAGAVRQARTKLIAEKAKLDGSLIVDDVKNAGKLAGDAEASERMSKGEEPSEKATMIRGQATKFRSIFSRLLGIASHAWSMMEALRRGETAAMGNAMKADHELEAVLKELGITDEEEYRWRSELVQVKLPGMVRTVGLTKGEMISLYNALQDPGTRDLLFTAGAKTERLRNEDLRITVDKNADVTNRDLFHAVERKVRADAKMLKVAEAMQEIMVKYGQAANQVSQYFYGTDEFTNEFFWPRMVQRKQTLSTEDDELNRVYGNVQANLKHMNLAKRRVRHNNPVVVRDAFHVFDEHMRDVSRYAFVTIPANELLNALGTELQRGDVPGEQTSAMRQIQLAFGKEYRRYIGNGLRAVMAGETEKPDNALLRGFKTVGRRISGATLAVLPSAILQNRYGGMANMAAWLHYNVSPEAAAAFVRTASLPQSLTGPEVKALLENGYLDDRWSGKSLRLALLGGSFDTSNFRAFREIDRWTDKFNRPLVAREMANSVAAYKALVRSGYTSEQAVDLIEQANRDTQNSTSELDKSQMARDIQSIFSTWFPFTSQGLVQWDFYLDTIAQAKRKGMKNLAPVAVAAVLNLFLLSIVIAALMRWLRKDDPLEKPVALGVDAVTQALEQRIPPLRLITETVNAALAGRKAGPINMVERSLSDIAASVGKVVRGSGNYMDAINLMTAAGKLVGVPVGGMAQYLKVALAQLGIETEGMKDRREDRWFDGKVSEMPEVMSSAMLSATADRMYAEAVSEGIVPRNYNRGLFRGRIRSRYLNTGKTITDAKRKTLSDY